MLERERTPSSDSSELKTRPIHTRVNFGESCNCAFSCYCSSAQLPCGSKTKTGSVFAIFHGTLPPRRIRCGNIDSAQPNGACFFGPHGSRTRLGCPRFAPVQNPADLLRKGIPLSNVAVQHLQRRVHLCRWGSKLLRWRCRLGQVRV